MGAKKLRYNLQSCHITRWNKLATCFAKALWHKKLENWYYITLVLSTALLDLHIYMNRAHACLGKFYKSKKAVHFTMELKPQKMHFFIAFGKQNSACVFSLNKRLNKFWYEMICKSISCAIKWYYHSFLSKKAAVIKHTTGHIACWLTETELSWVEIELSIQLHSSLVCQLNLRAGYKTILASILIQIHADAKIIAILCFSPLLLFVNT